MTADTIFAAPSDAAVPVRLVPPEGLSRALEADPPVKAWVAATGGARAGTILVPGEGGALKGVLHVTAGGAEPDGSDDPFRIAALVEALPPGDYAFADRSDVSEAAMLGWALAHYRYDRYLSAETPARPRLVAPGDVDPAAVMRLYDGVALGRDLINTPASDMGPQELEDATRTLAARYGAKVDAISGEALEGGYPMIHAVGKASPRRPRLIDLTWGRADAPKVTLVGKGVVFDTGGLDIKPASAMRNMKKDMGGAACALGLASMIMNAGIDVRLRVLIPAVENAIDGSAFRPGDVLRSRKGLTVEIGNTDAEGRLVLADALDLADEEAPDMLIDLATLTGAARVALGPEVMPFYTADDALAEAVMRAGRAVHDPLWRMPLWDGYDGWLRSKVADVCHISTQPFAGSVTAALFLRRFVSQAKSWIHFDVFGWNVADRPGRPEGGEAQAIRALHRVIADRYGEAR